MPKSRIDAEQIPATVMDEFCRLILETMQAERTEQKNGGKQNEKSNVS